jgi:hypothetical protein
MTGGTEFGSASDQCHGDGRVDRDGIESGGMEEGEELGGEELSGVGDGRAWSKVFAGEPDVFPGFDRIEDGDGTIGIGFAILLHDDGVGAWGNGSAGEDADGLAGLERGRNGLAGGGFTGDPEDGGQGGSIGGADGKAIDG